MTGAAELAAHYRRLIHDQNLRPGDVLPTYRQMREEHGVSEATVVRAMRMLKSEGLVAGQERGRTLVTARPAVVITGAERINRIKRGGPNYSHGETSRDHVAELRSCADPDIARELGIEPHSEILFRRRTFVQHNRPSSIGINIIAPRMWAAVPELLESRSLGFAWPESYRERTGRELTQGPEWVAARLAGADELRVLEVDVPDGAAVPVLVLRSVWTDDQGPVMVWEDTLRPGMWHVTEGS